MVLRTVHWTLLVPRSVGRQHQPIVHFPNRHLVPSQFKYYIVWCKVDHCWFWQGPQPCPYPNRLHPYSSTQIYEHPKVPSKTWWHIKQPTNIICISTTTLNYCSSKGAINTHPYQIYKGVYINTWNSQCSKGSVSTVVNHSAPYNSYSIYPRFIPYRQPQILKKLHISTARSATSSTE